MLKRWVAAAAVLLASLHLRAECKPGFVSAEKLLATGVGSAVFGDFDGDGRSDIALQYGYDKPLVFLNRGNRVFQPVNKVLVGGSSPDPLVAAVDVNGDGAVDLVYRGASTVAVSLGRGNGEFGPVIASAAAFADWRFVDINLDGRKDFVEYADGVVTEELSSGDGHFGTTKTLVSVPINQGGQFAVGDFDGDGFPDLYVAGLSFVGGAPAFHQWIYWNDGHGGFPTHAEQVTAGVHSLDMMLDAYDFDGDGAADILLRDAGATKIFRARNRSVTLQPIAVPDALLNAGATRFSGLGDFDGDGHPDALFQGGIVVWGPPSAARVDATVFDVLSGVQVADVDGDGIADIAGTGGAAGIFVIYGKSHSRALAGGTEFLGAGQYAGTAVADVNGDGLLDVVVSVQTSGDIETYLADGKGGFSPLPRQTLGDASSGVAGLADFDGDGKVDLLYRQGPNVKVFFGDGTGKFSDPVTYLNANLFGTARTGQGAAASAVVVAGGNVQLLSFAGRSVAATSIFPAPQYVYVDPIDVDGDGVTDLLIFDGSTTAQVVKKTSGGWATAAKLTGIPPLQVPMVAAGDVDGDGRNDIVTCFGAFCSLSLATASGYALAQGIPYGSISLAHVEIADMDHDGRAEIVTMWNGVLTSIRYRGAGHYETVNVANAKANGPFFLADVDGDGSVDAVVLTYSSVEVLRNGCTPARIRAALSESSPVAGDQPMLVVNVEPSFDYAGVVTLKEGSATLATQQPNLATDYATALFPLSALTAGVHVYTISYDDQFSGHEEATFSVTVLPSQPRKRAVHH